MLEKLDAVASRYEELCAKSEQPDFYGDPKRAAALLREKNELEPILLTLKPGAATSEDLPHPGEEFGFVLSGTAVLFLGSRSFRLKKGCSFYYKPTVPHRIENRGKTEFRLLWVSTPPSF